MSLLPLVPILQVAWADESISAEERKLIVDFARLRGVDRGKPRRQSALRMADPPSVARRVLARRPPGGRDARRAGSGAAQDLSADDLVKYSESIAAASGGILGLGKVSAGERAAIEQIQKALKSR